MGQHLEDALEAYLEDEQYIRHLGMAALVDEVMDSISRECDVWLKP